MDRTQIEMIKMRESALSNWREALQEEHPYVDLMPSPQPKDMKELKKEMKAKEKMEMGEELSIDDQMKMAREAGKKRNPNPDHKAIRGKMLRKPLPKDNRTDAEKMADATGPRDAFGRPAKSGYRGD